MKKSLIYALLLISIIACEGPEGPEGPAGPNGNNGINSLVALADEDAGDNCATGGIRITTGPDANGNGTLDASEVTETKYVCNGGGGPGSGGPKELRFFFGSYSAGSPDPAINILYDNFDYHNFEAYDSIVMVLVDVIVKDAGSTTVHDQNIVAQLVNQSDDNAPIAKSTLTVPTGSPYVSENFADQFPEGPFDLAVSLKAPADHTGVVFNVMILMYDRD